MTTTQKYPAAQSALSMIKVNAEIAQRNAVRTMRLDAEAVIKAARDLIEMLDAGEVPFNSLARRVQANGTDMVAANAELEMSTQVLNNIAFAEANED